MLVVPLSGDTVETSSGVKHTVLGYASFRGAPAVHTEDKGGRTSTVPFGDIQAINGAPVKLTADRLFNAAAPVRRRVQLPQANDLVVTGGQRLKVKRLRLRDDRLTTGLQVVGEPEGARGMVVTVRLADVERVERGPRSEDPARLKALYHEYLGRTA